MASPAGGRGPVSRNGISGPGPGRALALAGYALEEPLGSGSGLPPDPAGLVRSGAFGRHARACRPFAFGANPRA